MKQVRLDDDVVAALEARRDDRSVAQEANRLLRQALGLARPASTPSGNEGASSVKAPTGSLRRPGGFGDVPPLRHPNAGWQGR